ncbi:MAG: DUF2786 domain-containing protein [Alphaproteobacteria bacterium]|nr:DUF2786 domain-containing protein [Alphaproteobacteria bacterium]
MSATDREALLARIRKLMAMTTAAGCTEAEAMAAAEKLRRLLDENGIDPDHLDGLMVEEEAVGLGRTRRNQLDRLWPTIAWYCDCAMITRRGGGMPIEIVYAGFEPRPLIAHYIHDLCEAAAAHEVRMFKRSAEYRRRRATKTKRLAVAAFLEGFAIGVAAKLRRMKGDNPEGVALRLVADAEMGRRYTLSTATAIAPVIKKFENAKVSGHIAGLNTAINDGVGQAGGPVALIGRD